MGLPLPEAGVTQTVFLSARTYFGVCLGFMLDSEIFNIFIDGLEESRVSLINFTDDMRPEGRVNNDMERTLVQGDLIIWQPGASKHAFQ